MREVCEIDIHGATVEEAKEALDAFIEELPKEVTSVTVIHGYKNGRALLDFVRSRYANKRIKQKILSLNNGITEFLLK